MTDLTLISHHLCPYVQRAAIALVEKGAPFERVYIDLSNKPTWFLTLSPLGKVPVLQVIHGDGRETAVFESAVICEYIEETQAGTSLHPADPLERARHRAWIEFGSAVLGDIWNLETATGPERYHAAQQRLTEKFGRVEAELADGSYFAGPDFSLVDAAFAPVFRYFNVFDQLASHGIFDKTPKVRAWRSALSERPSVIQAAADGYEDRLHVFLAAHDAHILKIAA
ncbi:glutathione S-transferase family protein [Nitratireductor luteus]|uniref:glutathione S-transferase family protein n=1 Tax=Nitratireductor luteus TaxID=2976980 RepID=UPI00223F82F3|nr:glutathione S-transferase family protein [Nitratireductor luteus]